MRKLLLRTAILSVLATLPFSFAFGDVAITGSMQFHYVSKDPGTTVSGACSSGIECHCQPGVDRIHPVRACFCCFCMRPPTFRDADS